MPDPLLVARLALRLEASDQIKSVQHPFVARHSLDLPNPSVPLDHLGQGLTSPVHERLQELSHLNCPPLSLPLPNPLTPSLPPFLKSVTVLGPVLISGRLVINFSFFSSCPTPTVLKLVPSDPGDPSHVNLTNNHVVIRLYDRPCLLNPNPRARLHEVLAQKNVVDPRLAESHPLDIRPPPPGETPLVTMQPHPAIVQPGPSRELVINRFRVVMCVTWSPPALHILGPVQVCIPQKITVRHPNLPHAPLRLALKHPPNPVLNHPHRVFPFGLLAPPRNPVASVHPCRVGAAQRHLEAQPTALLFVGLDRLHLQVRPTPH